ncbi:MAG: Potassium voltage-gated channel subfamily KQT [Hyphomonadaceae bacterium]|nr:MAG: Potassium voltage-gated channel subfamily KQT [Hyphomonadaceae bacterium]KAF0186965.1 MAG: Potassium voltage-gated channel subfamily KQT [Hyphomonadaceae bacterium]
MDASKAIQIKSFRRKVFEELEPAVRAELGLSLTNKLLIFVIIIGTITAILGTEPNFPTLMLSWLGYVESALGLVFLVEYIVRLWIAPELDATKGAWNGRVRFIFSFSGLIDLLVVISTVAPIFSANTAILRIIRLVRIFRVAKLGRMSTAMRSLSKAIHSRRYEFILTLFFAFGLLLIGSSALYLIEGAVQPDKFGSIPRALWWSVVTLTTIGYGDVYPITVFGKIVAAFIAIVGIGIIALPAGILAAAFSDAMQNKLED